MVDSRFFFNILFLTVELQNELLCHFVGQVKAVDAFLFLSTTDPVALLFFRRNHCTYLWTSSCVIGSKRELQALKTWREIFLTEIPPEPASVRTRKISLSYSMIKGSLYACHTDSLLFHIKFRAQASVTLPSSSFTLPSLKSQPIPR